MFRALVAGMCGLLLFVAGAAAQPQGGLIDLTKVKVRPDKMYEYEAAVKRLVDVNQKNNGDRWIAFSTEYGDAGTLYFAAPRANMAAVEAGLGAFEKALGQGLGAAESQKLIQDLNSASLSLQSEIRRPRADLGVNMPPGMTDRMNAVGHARWIRTLKVEMKPGKVPEFKNHWTAFQSELAKATPKVSLWVSQSVTGPSVLYFSSYFKSMAEMDAADAAMQTAGASQAYADLQRAAADLSSGAAWEIYRLRPELSCPPDEVVAMDPDFWKPKVAISDPKKSKKSKAK
jgi:hypothetical protein